MWLSSILQLCALLELEVLPCVLELELSLLLMLFSYRVLGYPTLYMPAQVKLNGGSGLGFGWRLKLVVNYIIYYIRIAIYILLSFLGGNPFILVGRNFQSNNGQQYRYGSIIIISYA